MMLALYAISHFLTDAVCASTIFSQEHFIPFILLYNLLAFSTQAVVGVFSDILRKHRAVAVIGGVMTALGAIIPIYPVVNVFLIGMGNSLFHVGGGADILTKHKAKAAPLGIFVAPGNMGLLLGTLFPTIKNYSAALLLLFSIAILFFKNETKTKITNTEHKVFISKNKLLPVLAVVMIVFSVAVRAAASYSMQFVWKTELWHALALGMAITLGKAAGGFVVDRLKAMHVVFISIFTSGILLSFFSNSMAASLLGQFLLNLSMPLTLLMIYLILPQMPGFSFGLAASVLFPGMMIGMGFTMQPALLFTIFICNTALMLLAVNIFNKGGLKIGYTNSIK